MARAEWNDLKPSIGRIIRFIQKPACGLCIPLRREQEIDSVAVLVHCAMEIFPFTFDRDIRLIKTPTQPRSFLVFAKGFLDTRSVIQ